MPELGFILASEGGVAADWEERLLAVMCEPAGGEDCALNYAVRLYELGGGAAPREVIDAVLGPGLERLQRRRKVAELHGQIAGDLLFRVRSLELYAPRKASLGKAMRMYLKETAGRRTNIGMEMPSSRAALVKIFGRYRSVAHLWAVWRRGLRVGARLPLSDFLALAEHYRLWGETYRSPVGATGSKRGSETLLDPATTWKLPAQVDPATLPVVLPAFDLSLVPGSRFDEFLNSTPA